MKKQLQLSHPYTPTELDALNLKIEGLFNDDALDEAQLLQLISQRDEIVQLHLKSLEKQQLKDFAQAELSVNKLLVECTKQLQSAVTGAVELLDSRQESR